MRESRAERMRFSYGSRAKSCGPVTCPVFPHTPVKRYIERSEAAFERTTSEVAILRKENTEFRELLRIRKKRKKGKRVAIKGKFVFNTQEILELVEEAEAETSKRKLKKKRTMRATTPEIESKQEEDIKEDVSESGSDCIIVASSRLN